MAFGCLFLLWSCTQLLLIYYSPHNTRSFGHNSHQHGLPSLILSNPQHFQSNITFTPIDSQKDNSLHPELFHAHPSKNHSSTTSPTVDLTELPQWIQDYVAWHGEMRRQFPGKHLFDDPNAPPVLIRMCLGLCGGLHDRLGQLPWDLYLANATRRVLLLHWHRPVPLEHFVVPNLLDWSVPRTIPYFFPEGRTVPIAQLRIIRSRYPDFFDGYPADHPDATEFWQQDLPAAIARATTGEFRKHKVLRHRLLGHLHESALEDVLRSLGETDMIHGTKSFGTIFHMFFRPSEGVQQELQQIYQELNLRPGAYSGVHCRVRHPKATPKEIMVKGKNEQYPADKTGLPWEGDTKRFAIEIATYALKCAQTLPATHGNPEPIYFFSDSNDLVEFMTHELADEQYVEAHKAEVAASPLEQAALELVQSSQKQQRSIVARNATAEK